MGKIMVDVKLVMDEIDLQCLVAKSGCADLSVNNLLSEFVGDLVEGVFMHGRNEHLCALTWYDARYCSCINNVSFLHWLIANDYDVFDVVDTYDSMIVSRDRLNEYENSCFFSDTDELCELKAEFDLYSEEFDYYYEEYRDCSPDAVISDEINKCREWINAVEELEKTVVKHEEKK